MEKGPTSSTIRSEVEFGVAHGVAYGVVHALVHAEGAGVAMTVLVRLAEGAGVPVGHIMATRDAYGNQRTSGGATVTVSLTCTDELGNSIVATPAECG